MAPVLTKSLSRLSRENVIKLCVKWTQQTSTSTPYLSSNRNLLEQDEEDYLHEPAENIAALKALYKDLKDEDHGTEVLSKRDIIDRIVDGDWRRGLSLQQLADVDFASLEQNDTALRWSALKLVPYNSSEAISKASLDQHPAKKRKISNTSTQPTKQAHYPSVLPATFVANLRSHISPLVKAHYSLHRLSSPSNLVILRLYMIPNTPFAPVNSNVPRNVRQATDSSRVMYIALPDSCPYIYISLSGSTGSAASMTNSKSKDTNTAPSSKIDMAAMKRIIVESIPKALSRPQERWSLESTKLTCRSLKSMVLLRGNDRPGTAGGCYSRFSEEYEWSPNTEAQSSKQQQKTAQEKTTNSSCAEPTPLTVSQPQSMANLHQSNPHESLVTSRFGAMSSSSHAKLDRLHVTINDLLSQPATSKPKTKTISTANPDSSQQSQRKSKRKRRSLEDIEAGRDEVIEVEAASTKSKAEPAPINLTFTGIDVFRGLRELALVDGGRYIDLARLPAWATGETGLSGLTV